MARIIYTLALFFSLALTAYAQLAGEGRSFVMVFPYTEPPVRYIPPSPRLLLNSQPGASVRIVAGSTGAVQTVMVPGSGVMEVLLDSSMVMLPEIEGILPNTIQISSTAPVTAAIVLDRVFATEGYAAIPDSLLGFNYQVTGTDFSLRGSSITIVAAEDNTTIEIVPTVPTRSGHARDLPFSVVLDRGDAYQLLTDRFVDTDLSGTTIRSDKPCGVISASICSEIPIPGDHSCNPMVEQIPPSHAGATDFLVAPVAQQDRGFYRVMAVCGPTPVYLDGVEVAQLEPGGTYDFASVLPNRITATDSILVMQFVTSTSHGLQDRLKPYGDPSWMTVTPVREWGNRFQVSVPAIDARNDGDGFVEWKYYMQVAVRIGSESSLVIDGAPPVWNRRSSTVDFVIGSVEITPAVPHTIQAATPVTVMAVGYSKADAFAFNPAAVQRQVPMRLQEQVWDACGDTLDTTLVVHNRTGGDWKFTAITALGGLDCQILSPQGNDITIRAHDSLVVRVRLKGLLAGPREGYIGFSTTFCPMLGAVVKLRVQQAQVQLAPASGSWVDFPILTPGRPYTERVISISNTGSVPMEVMPPQISSTRFILVSPAFPLTLAPGAAVDVTLRFVEGDIGTFEGTIEFGTTQCPGRQSLLLRGIQTAGALAPVPIPAPIHLLCGPKNAQQISFQIANLGDAADVITDARIVGADAREFVLQTPLNGVTILPNERTDVRVLYTPGRFGRLDAMLRVISGASGADTLLVPFDASNDTLFVESIEDMLDFGFSDLCQPSPRLQIRYVNRGSIPVTGIAARLTLQSLITISLSGDSLGIGDTVTLVLAIDPATAGPFTGGVRFNLPECGDDLFVPSRGRRTGALFTYSADTLDFGTVPYCAGTGELVLTLTNNGDLSDTLDLVHAPASDPFQATLPADPLSLEIGRESRIVVRFRPVSAGVFADSIVLRSRACGTLKTILLRGSRDDRRLATDVQDIDFGAVDLGASSSRIVRIFNRTGFARTIAPGILEGNLSGVRVVRPVQDITLAPGDSIDLELEYVPELADDILSGLLKISERAPCTDILVVNVHGSARSRQRLAGLRWETISGTTGQAATARLFIQLLNMEEAVMDMVLRTSLRFNASMLSPLGVRAGSGAMTAQIVSDVVAGGDRVITIEARGAFPLDSVLLELRLLPALGSAESTPLAFDGADMRFRLNDVPITIIDTIDGAFTLLDICREGGTRLFSTTGFMRLAVARPNPARDRTTIEFETVENGRARLLIHDARGEVVAVPYDAVTQPGSQAISADVSMLPNGAYWVVLETPTTTLRQPMTISR